MPLEVNYSSGQAITIPYPPLVDRIRNNRGFVDTRGRPDLALRIAEGSQSKALQNCLVRISKENLYFSIGCDLGHHPEPDSPAAQRCCAGGYLQVAPINYADCTTDQIDAFGFAIADSLGPLSKKQFWELNLIGEYVNFQLPSERPIQAPSMQIWFYARARDLRRAISSRESLLGSISQVLHTRPVLSTLGS